MENFFQTQNKMFSWINIKFTKRFPVIWYSFFSFAFLFLTVRIFHLLFKKRHQKAAVKIMKERI